MKNKFDLRYLIIGASVVMSGCSDSFLEPDPLSFFEPTATFTTEAGLAAAMAQADRNMKLYWCNASDVQMPICTEFLFSDMLVISATDQTKGLYDMDKGLVPSQDSYRNAGDQDHEHCCIHFWNENYAGIKYANTVIQYAPQVTSLDESVKNAYIGRALFHRSFRYYALVHQFGNVPLITKLVEVPKQNYRSTAREAILEMIESDMLQAVEYVPDQTVGNYTSAYPGGYVNKAACRMLLAKIYMANYKFDKAKEQLDILINNSGLKLMTETFGEQVQPAASETWHVTPNVIWDLHRGENVFNSANKEIIMGMVNSGLNVANYTVMRCLSPFVFNGSLTTPSGKQGLKNYNRDGDVKNGNYNPELDYQRVFGRGVATFRFCTWAQHALWNVNGKFDNGDLRRSREAGNWMHMEDLKYNNREDQEWYGKNLRLWSDDGKLLCGDTIRRWFDIPLYKFYYLDGDRKDNLNSDGFRGVQKNTDGDMYLYRLSEAYLLRAECNFYMGNGAAAAEDVNTIRRRAHCEQLYAGNVTIGDIFDERARELYLEEWRHSELVRASFCLAHTGKPDEFGNTYTMDDLLKSEGTGKTGGSYWYQRCINYNWYNNGVTYNIQAAMTGYQYKMGKQNMFWPIPEFAIVSNDKDQLWQNYGYSGYDASIPVWDNWQDAVADESTTTRE